MDGNLNLTPNPLCPLDVHQENCTRYQLNSTLIVSLYLVSTRKLYGTD